MSVQKQSPRIVLASASPARSALLRAAGLEFDIQPADLDEEAIRQSLGGPDEVVPPGDVASVLAQAKAAAVSENFPDALVIGADQVLAAEGKLFSKPSTAKEARDQLLALRGRQHSLVSAVACAMDGQVDWYHDETAVLAMREFTTDFLGAYLAAAGDSVLSSVGGYQLEGPGVQLFSKIDGDYFTILGLPMLALLDYLRRRNVLVA